MSILTILGETLPILGTIGLLGLWLYQQTGVERRAAAQRRLASARAVFQTYQSNNALFNAVNETLGGNAKASKQLRTFQVYNYELGLKAIEDALSEAEKASLPAAPDVYDPTEDVQTKMDRTQVRLGQLQDKLNEKEESVRREADAARARYLRLYVALSIVSLFGAVCKVLDKLSAAPS